MKHQRLNLYLLYFFCGFPHTSVLCVLYSGTICTAVGTNYRSAVENDHIIVDYLKYMTCIESCCKE